MSNCGVLSESGLNKLETSYPACHQQTLKQVLLHQAAQDKLGDHGLPGKKPHEKMTLIMTTNIDIDVASAQVKCMAMHVGFHIA